MDYEHGSPLLSNEGLRHIALWAADCAAGRRAAKCSVSAQRRVSFRLFGWGSRPAAIDKIESGNVVDSICAPGVA
jgi:hypothetical protein